MTTARDSRDAVERTAEIPAGRIGLIAGLTGILCCVGPTMLALFGLVGAATAYTWANDLYDGYAWWFRLAGLMLLSALVWWTLRRRDQCNLGGIRAAWPKILLALGVAVATYAALYGVTTWLGTLA